MLGNDLDYPIVRYYLGDTLYRLTPVGLVNQKYRFQNSKRAAQWLEAPFYLIHIPKCAGKSVAAAIGLVDPGHLLPRDLPDSIVDKLSQKPCLAITRDPLDRYVSTFLYAHRFRISKNVSPLSFLSQYYDINDSVAFFADRPKLVGHYFLRPSYDYIDSWRSRGASVTEVRFHTLEDGFRDFCAAISLAKLTLPKVNVSQHIQANHEINARLSDSSKVILQQIYKENILHFGAPKA